MFQQAIINTGYILNQIKRYFKITQHYKREKY